MSAKQKNASYENEPIVVSVKNLHKSFRLPTERAWA